MDSTPNPYAPPSAPLSDKSAESDRWASRGSRFGARMLDGLIVAVVMFVPLFALGGFPNSQALAGGARANPFWFYTYYWHSAAFWPTSAVILVLLAINLYLLFRFGQTIGKKLVGIRIVRTDGSRAGLARIIFIRDLPFRIVAMIPLIGGLFSLADPLFIFSESRRCLHDRLAGTIVMKA
jgi:uncharacterized RDD family membrane protein YckC